MAENSSNEPHILVENQCSREKITDAFLPVIEDAIAAYQVIFGDTIHNIRLLGSVARGEAGHYSDIDFIAVLRVNPDVSQLRELERKEIELRDEHRAVSRVDLEAVAADGLNEFRRFVFATDSVSLFGPDIYTLQSQTWDREELARMVTPDLAELVASYRKAVEKVDGDNEQLLSFYSRVIGKDILKCFRRFSLLSGGQYERNIGKIYRQLLHYVPEREEFLHELFELYANPSSDKQRLLRALSAI